MSYQLTTDTDLFRLFWKDERDNTPRWMADGNGTWRCTEEDFLDYCNRMEVYTDGHSLVYVDTDGDHAELHYSLLRGARPDIEGLIDLAPTIFNKVRVVFAWVGGHNRGLKKILTSLGFTETGLKMLKGSSHSRILEWTAMALDQNMLLQTVKSC